MKILLVADLHYTLPQFDWVLGVAPAYGLVVIAGDLLETNSIVDHSAQTVVVLTYLKRLRALTQVLVCSGNHDLDGPNGQGEMQAGWMRQLDRLKIAADGETVTVGDTTFTCCAWWDGPHTQKAIGDQLAAVAATRDGPWIWIYHAPPPDSPVSWNGHRSHGDTALQGWVKKFQPDVVLSGHVHEAPFSRAGSWADQIGDTWLFNAGRQIGPVPTAISIDTDVRAAAWFSIEGAEMISMAEPLGRPIPPLEAMPEWVPL